MVSWEEWTKRVAENINKLGQRVELLERDLTRLREELKPYFTEKNKARILELLTSENKARSEVWIDRRLNLYALPLLHDLEKEGVLERRRQGPHRMWKARVQENL